MSIFKSVRKFTIVVPLSVKTVKLPLCVNCKFFIEHKNNYLYNSYTDTNYYGRCKNFGSIDLVTGVTEYRFASSCREDNYIKTTGADSNLYQCGTEGLLFEQK